MPSETKPEVIKENFIIWLLKGNNNPLNQVKINDRMRITVY